MEDYTKLEAIMNEEEVVVDKIYDYYAVKNKKEMKKLIVDNLKQVKVEFNDSLGYMAPGLIFDYVEQESNNIFYEKLMVASLFLRAFAKYETSMVMSFAHGIGVIDFVFTFEEVLGETKEYKFFKDIYSEYKQDRYFREQTSRLLSIFDEIEEQVGQLDLEEIKKYAEAMNIETK